MPCQTPSASNPAPKFPQIPPAEIALWERTFADWTRVRASQPKRTDDEWLKVAHTDAFAQECLADAEHDMYATDWTNLNAEVLPEQKVLLTANGEPCLRSETLNEIFAYRGIGKSMLIAGLIRVLIQGGELLTFKSDGGNRVLLVDGELPAGLLQKRLQLHVGETDPSALMVRSVANMPGHCMPPLSDPKQQKLFVDYIERARPDVIIFDTRTAIFKHDTNNAEQLLRVNDFLIKLRSYGFCVLITHHAGKNGTQRGRTDNDDDLDLIIKLDKRAGWEPGMGLEFDLKFDKVRYGDHVRPFEAKFDTRTGWQLITGATTTYDRVVGALKAGRSIQPLAKELGIGVSGVLAIKKRAEDAGECFPANRSGPKRKADVTDDGGDDE